MHFPFHPASSSILDSNALETDYKQARSSGATYLGETCLYYPGLLKLQYLPYRAIQWAYLRAEETRMTMCCGKGYLVIWYLVLWADGKQVVKLEFPKKESAEKVLTSLTDKNPDLVVGYTADNKELFAAI